MQVDRHFSLNGKNGNEDDEFVPFSRAAFPEDVFPEDVFPSDVFPRGDQDDEDDVE